MKAGIFISEHCRVYAPLAIIIFARMIYFIVANVFTSTNSLLNDCVYLLILLFFSLIYICLFKRDLSKKQITILKHPVYVFFISVFCGMLLNSVLKATIVGSTNEIPDVTLTYEKVVLTCIIFPFVEELIFRRVFIQDLSAFGIKTSIVMSALLFALSHDMSEWLYVFALGIALGYIYLSRNLLYSILFHVAHNAFLIVSVCVRNHADVFKYRVYSVLCVFAILIISVRGIYVIFRGCNEEKS